MYIREFFHFSVYDMNLHNFSPQRFHNLCFEFQKSFSKFAILLVNIRKCLKIPKTQKNDLNLLGTKGK